MGVVGSGSPRAARDDSGVGAVATGAPVESGPAVAPWSCGCGRRWRSLIEAHCSACHRQFSGVTAFDRHRRAGRCHNPARLRTAGVPVLAESVRTGGPVWAFPTSPTHQGFQARKNTDLRESQ